MLNPFYKVIHNVIFYSFTNYFSTGQLVRLLYYFIWFVTLFNLFLLKSFSIYVWERANECPPVFTWFEKSILIIISAFSTDVVLVLRCIEGPSIS